MNHVVRFWSMHPRHRERAVMGDAHGNTAASQALELGKPQLEGMEVCVEGMEVCVSTDSLMANLRVTTSTRTRKSHIFTSSVQDSAAACHGKCTRHSMREDQRCQNATCQPFCNRTFLGEDPGQSALLLSHP